MKWIDKFDLFLFDFDGLLVNTENLHLQAYAKMCSQRGYTLNWSFNHYCSIAHIDAVSIQKGIYSEFPKLYAEEPKWSVLYGEKKQAYLELLQSQEIKLLPGVENLLKTLQVTRKKRCVVTNSSKEQVGIIRNALPALNTVPVWITREQYENPKPAPDAYFKAVQLLADPGDRIIGFEDTLRGLEALKHTEAKAVLICSKEHPQLNHAALKSVAHFDSLDKIPHNAF